MNKVSVIIPIYRVEAYLRRCVDSVLNQTYTNIEVILVDDGSPDNCPSLCDEYAELDRRVRVIHQKNQGLSAARNAGIDISCGEYLFFVDGDDYIEKNTIEVLLTKALEHDADCAMCEIKIFKSDTGEFNCYKPLEDGEYCSGEFLKERIFNTADIRFIVAWNRLYKREVFNSIRYPVGKIHEDEFILFDLYKNINKYYYISEPLYCYMIHPDSISSSVNIRRLDKVEALLLRMREYSFDQDLSDIAYKWLNEISHFYISYYDSIDWKLDEQHKRRNKELQVILNSVKVRLPSDIGFKGKLVYRGSNCNLHTMCKLRSKYQKLRRKLTLKQKVDSLIRKSYIRLCRILPIKKNRIVLWANDFKHYGCNPKYIALKLLEKYPGKFELIWVFKSDCDIPSDFPKEIRVVRYNSREYWRMIHTARFVICNMRTRSSFRWKKRSKQIYIQTWHGLFGPKKVEGDAEELLSPDYVADAKNDAKMIDLMISGCRETTQTFRTAFWYDGELMEVGTPRCDILVNGSSVARDKVYKEYGISNDKKLLLYAPTFRANKASDFLGLDFEVLQKTLGDGWVIGARLHPNVKASIIPEGAISMTGYNDMQELLAAADMLITDYSSTMFEFMLTKKPCFLYTPDLEEYIATERGLLLDMRALPFPLAESMEELSERIESFDNSKYQRDINQMKVQIGCFEDGHAAQKVCDYIYSHIK